MNVSMVAWALAPALPLIIMGYVVLAIGTIFLSGERMPSSINRCNEWAGGAHSRTLPSRSRNQESPHGRYNVIRGAEQVTPSPRSVVW